MTISMRKGDAPVSLQKLGAITVTCSWPAATDYDLYALVVLRDGGNHYVANFGAKNTPAQQTFKGVTISRDAGREVSAGAISEETLTIEFTGDEVLSVVPVAYSAQSNGTGSFKKYKVSLAVDNGAGQRIEISADNANDNNRVYSCAPAIIHNEGNTFKVEAVELYSKPSSEMRPSAKLGWNGSLRVDMDGGPKNDYK